MGPAPQAHQPTGADAGDNLAAGFGDEPENEGVVKPALRKNGSKQKETCVFVANFEKSQEDQDARQHEQGDEMAVFGKLMRPLPEPAGCDGEAEGKHRGAGNNPASRQVS